MIPPIIHQIWIGDEPPIITRCIQTVQEDHRRWQHQLHHSAAVLDDPAFHPIHHQLQHFFHSVLPTASAKHSTAALQTDVLKLCHLFLTGGIVLDADMFSLKPLDGFRTVPILLAEINAGSLCGEAVIGAPAQCPFIWGLLCRFIQMQPINQTIGMTIGTFAEQHHVKPFPPEYFIPHKRNCQPEDRYRTTENTHTIHLWHRTFPYDFEQLERIRRGNQ